MHPEKPFRILIVHRKAKQTASDRLYSIAWRADDFYVDHLCIRFSYAGGMAIFFFLLMILFDTFCISEKC